MSELLAFGIGVALGGVAGTLVGGLTTLVIMSGE